MTPLSRSFYGQNYAIIERSLQEVSISAEHVFSAPVRKQPKYLALDKVLREVLKLDASSNKAMIVFGSAIDRSGVYLQTVSLENPQANTTVKYDKANALSRHYGFRFVISFNFQIFLNIQVREVPILAIYLAC